MSTGTTKLTKGDQSPALADAANMVWYKTVIHIYPVTDSQLEELTAGYNSLHLVCFGICVGAACSLLIALEQTASTAAERPYYFAGMVAMFGLSVMFGINGVMNYVRASRRKAKLYRESIPVEK
jgi:NhaP-type Na+/H+ or K+/H+ antiporter